jgi:chromosome segregation ATPase
VSTIKQQVGNLQAQEARAKSEVQTLEEKVKSVQKDYNEVKTKNQDLLAKDAEHKKSAATSTALKDENAKLRAKVSELQSNAVAPGDSEALKTLKERFKETETMNAQLESSLSDWQALAKVRPQIILH